MKNLLYRAWSAFLTGFGDVKIFKWPFWFVYDPNYFKMTGEKMLDVIGQLQPGDVIIRGYDNYLDSKFINGDFSHAGIYVGKNQVIHAVAPNVEKINVIEFMECDRIAVCRPVRGAKQAVAKAKHILSSKTPYDFSFNSKDVNALYCFELAAECYRKLDIRTYTVRKFFGLVKKEVYLAASFKTSKDFKTVFEFNPKRDIDYFID